MGDFNNGGFKAGLKRRTGKGPAPARHIPWSEIFKRHISLVEGHLKMLDTVFRHTVPESDNYRTMTQFMARAREMLHVSKETERTFVLPADHLYQVPLGTSSASIYPGYPPANHKYGKAAEEYGRVTTNVRARGEEYKPAGVDHETHQGQGVKRRKLSQSGPAKAAKESGNDKGSRFDIAATNDQANHNQPVPSDNEGANPHFFIDTKPTPVNLPGVAYRPLKRSSSPPEPVEATKTKKQKMKHEGSLPVSTKTNGAEFEDISAEVDARMKEKEEKRKKKEKKRKRDTESSSALVNEEPNAVVEVDKPKKKKPKKENRDAPLDKISSRKRQGEDGEAAAGIEGIAKKKRRKSRGEAADSWVSI